MRTCILLLAGLAVSFAPAPFPRPGPDGEELKKLAGEWMRVSCTINGKPLWTSHTTTAVIAGNRISYTGQPTSTNEWKITVDAEEPQGARHEGADGRGTGHDLLGRLPPGGRHLDHSRLQGPQRERSSG